MIAIIDYSMGNLHSLQKALDFVGADSMVTADAGEILAADKVILPGVGAFGDAMRCLIERDLARVVLKVAAQGTPLLGICLGMQLLFKSSSEHGTTQGLGLLDGNITYMDADGKIPHMGWNTIKVAKPCKLLEGVEGHVYFVHSYCAQDSAAPYVAGITNYTNDFASSVVSGNIMGTQFHPEKSGEVGLRILKNFVEL